ncbi:ferredoxin reductase [Dyella sp. 20L07]|uniref:ferredoxin reductase n=1 Tax=Dyella sp. 20L07 TaxID=3384240 RepID=UPI003D266588
MSRFNAGWSWDRPLARVVGHRRESSNAYTLLLQPNRRWGDFRPGQHLNVGAEIDGVRVSRSYSLTGTARADRRLAITVKAIEGGRLSQHLCHATRVGDVLEIGPAYGEMILPDAVDGPRLFLAGGSGITPLIAMIRQLAERGMVAPLTLLYWVRHRDERCFVDELRALSTKHVDFRVHFFLTRDAASADDEHEGHLCDVPWSSLVPDLQAREVYACGPDGFVESARTETAALARSFQAEAFTLPTFNVGDQGSVQITLAASQRTVTVPRGATLLAALEAEGVTPASGCRMGICNTCACGKRSGATRNLRTGDLEHDPVSALRLCISSASSDLVLEL